ncbi:response regulator [Leptothoe sp. ISB3NOV94-8A]
MDHVSRLSSVNSPNRSNPLILIVDDDRSLQMLLTVAMEQEGFKAVQANSGEQCLNDYHRLQPDMVLLDAVMPGMDGFECCHKLRQLPHAGQIPILMITVLDNPEYVDKAFQAGATDYITKPIQWPVLSHRVHRLLDAYQNAQQAELSLQVLKRHQIWEQMQSQFLKSLQVKKLNEFLEFSLKKICDFLDCDRTLLYQISTQSWLQVTDHTQELPDLQLIDSKSFWAALTKENLLYPSWMSGTSGESFQPLHQDICKKLQFQSLCLYPIVLDDILQAILFVGYHQASHKWLDFEQRSIQSIAEFITISFRLHRSLMSTS